MSQQELDRRSFARRLAGAAITSAVTAGVATSAAPAAIADDKPVKDAAAEGKTPEEPKTSESLVDQPPAELLLALVRQKYPHPLTEEQADAIRSQLAWYWQRSAVLSSFPLTNADEPAPIFAAYRGKGE